jgi:endonuclease I
MVRGEIARSQLYMLLMYPANCSITENFMIQTMLRWDLDYAPTIERDGQRQAGIEKYQNTRNPFIDNRKLSCYIWGDFNQWTQDICATVI